jgi:hypothetical protein
MVAPVRHRHSAFKRLIEGGPIEPPRRSSVKSFSFVGKQTTVGLDKFVKLTHLFGATVNGLQRPILFKKPTHIKLTTRLDPP